MPSPEHEQVVAMLKNAPRSEGASPTLEEQRLGYDAMAALHPLADDIETAYRRIGCVLATPIPGAHCSIFTAAAMSSARATLIASSLRVCRVPPKLGCF